jgi:ABC-2 type transport system ATP-binding protein
VTRTYGDVVALDNVTVDLARGVTILLGRNGAGKSTLSRIIAGLEAPGSGALMRHGEVVTGACSVRAHHAATGWLPQSFAAPGGMRVTEYLTYAGWLKGLRRRALAPSVSRAIECTDLSLHADRHIRELSGGMLRRLGIAQAIVHDPDFLVLDEPTVGLDPENVSSSTTSSRAWPPPARS